MVDHLGAHYLQGCHQNLELLRVGAGLRVPSLVLLWIGNTVPRRGEPASEAAVLPGARARGEVRVRGGLRL